jgi:processive 1,2-diacylglycerol beta-glucosyltransferase/1,2-diacylglycerol 3-beta-galactosyltransferase
MADKKKKFLFAYLKTGGGHLAPARSVANYILKRNDDIDVLLIDGFEKTGKLGRFIVEDGYRILQSKAKWFFELIYAVHKLKFISWFSSYLVSINTQKYLEEIILKEQPNKIVIFHFFLIQPIYKVLKKYNLSVEVITIVTDPYTAHPIWFLNKKQNFIVFSEKLKSTCIKKGIAPERLTVFPFVLDEKFSHKPSEEEILKYKTKHGFKSNKILLIMGGGDGIPKGIPILKSILSSKTDFEIAFVCGKNKKMFEAAVKLKENENLDRLKIYGYIDFVYELLCVSDAVITKCGASTFMEILLSGKIPIVNSYIWEQEKGNVDFLVENKLGIFEKKVHKLPAIITELFEEKDLLNKYKNNIERAGLQNGTAQVAEFILS